MKAFFAWLGIHSYSMLYADGVVRRTFYWQPPEKIILFSYRRV